MKPLDASMNQSTQVAFRVLEEMVAIGKPVELSVLARRLDMPKPRVFRFLRTLALIGYVLQDRNNERYRLSLKLFHLGQAIADKTDLLTEARPMLIQLSKTTGLTAAMASPEADGMRVLDLVRAHSPVDIVTTPGTLLGFHSSAAGKVALAFGEADCWAKVETVLGGPENTVRLAALRARVERVRQDGWSDGAAETLAGINAVSAPVYSAGRRFTAAITIAGTMAVLPSPPTQAQIDAVVSAARTLSANLGSPETPE